MDIINRFLRPPDVSYFLFGPRGTGKSLWVKNTYPNAIIIDLLDPVLFHLYNTKPEQLFELLEAHKNKKYIIIDEIQKAPELLPVVHRLIESHRGYQFILTGSSSRKLKRTGADLLGGRALLCHLHPFMAAELGERFIMEDALSYGMLPLVISSKNPLQQLKAYLGLYLHEEIQTEANVRNIGNFARFLETMSLSHASLLNINNISRECEVNRKTVEGYIHILEELAIGYTIPVFTRKSKRRMAGHRKFYFFDVGVFASLRTSGPLDDVRVMEGAALEGLVAQHLKGWIEYRSKSNKLYYWRTRGGNEIDFVIYGEDGLYAFEVKNSKKIHSHQLRSLNTFLQDYPVAKAVILYRGNDRLKKGNIFCIPCDEFLRLLVPTRNITDIMSNTD